jgi:flagellar motor switch protein FliN/FliY
MKLGPGSIIEVGHMVDEPVDLLVNGKLIARGDVVVVDEKFGLRITEIVSARERIESLR